MDRRSKFLLKNLWILTISNFASKILVFLLVPLYTSVLTTEEYGIFDLVVSTTSLLMPLLTANIVDAVMRFTMDNACSKEEVASIGIKYVSVSVLIVGGALALSSAFDVIPSLSGTRLFVFLYYLSSAFNQYFIQYAKGIERVRDMGIASVLGTVVMIGGNILFLVILKTGLNGFFIANILAQIVPAIYFFFRLKFWKVVSLIRTNKKLEREMIAYSFPLVCTSLGWWVNNAADKYVVTWLCGVAANGVLSVSYKIPSIITTLHGILNQAWQISAIKEYESKDVAVFYGKTFKCLNVLMCAACSFLILITRVLARFLYANEFFAAWQYVPFLLISTTINFASGFIGPILAAKKDSKSMAAAAVYGAVANIIMNIALVYLIGVQGATIATVISSYIIYYCRKKTIKNELIIDNYWKIIATWLLLCIQAIVEIYTGMWWMGIVLMGAMLAINWSDVKRVLSMVIRKKRF